MTIKKLTFARDLLKTRNKSLRFSERLDNRLKLFLARERKVKGIGRSENLFIEQAIEEKLTRESRQLS